VQFAKSHTYQWISVEFPRSISSSRQTSGCTNVDQKNKKQKISCGAFHLSEGCPRVILCNSICVLDVPIPLHRSSAFICTSAVGQAISWKQTLNSMVPPQPPPGPGTLHYHAPHHHPSFTGRILKFSLHSQENDFCGDARHGNHMSFKPAV
jgi:hypothetical protein